MKDKEKRILISSVSNLTKRLEHYGDANIDKISLLKLIYKYSCYSTTYSQLQRLNKMVSKLQITDPFICMERQAVSGADYTPPVGVVEVGVDANVAPTLTDSAITLIDGASPYTFSIDDLFSGYADADNDVMGNFVIKTLPANGTLQYDGVDVTVETLYSTTSLLTYVKDSDLAYGTTFDYAAYDSNIQLPLQSNIVTCTVTVEVVVIPNEPATVGDRAQYSGNRTTTVFSSADFTTKTIAPYFDPENNELDAIRIDEISTANEGTYYYYGALVVEGQDNH